MKICCIEGCGLSSDKNVSLFDFPTSRLLRKRWLDAINPSTKLADDALICSRHFADHDYEEVRGRIRLKGKVVPSVFKEEEQLPTLKDPLDLPVTDIAEPSAQSDSLHESADNDNHNGKVDIVSKSDDKGSGSDSDKSKGLTDTGHKPQVDNNNGKVDRKNGNVDAHNETVDGDNEKDDGDDAKVDGDNEKVDGDDVKVDGDNEKVGNDNENGDSGNGKVDSDNGKVNKDDGDAAKSHPKRVKKKWVPLRNVPSRRSKRMRNGDIDLSEDSDSTNSNDSDAPSPPVLEDLEEQLPNYQIENKKTERQMAAMAEAAEPHETATADVDEVTQPNPVFIELSVGQDSNTAEEQPNDCLMVLESVQCEIDPTLMLEAREEDEECLEQIDLDDLDDDDVKSVDESPEKSPKKSKTPTDPISLLTSSDEDDVILQEPHIDCLSVSDETDEDDVPLTRLIKTKQKTKRKKTTKKKLNAQDIINGVEDFYCMHCHHLSTSMSDHKKHVRTHVNYQTESLPTTKVYQICKECGFTTSSKSQLYRHQKKHTSEKRYRCPLCSYRSKYNMSLMYHLKTHEYDPNMYNCGACGLELEDKISLLEHQKCCYALEEEFKCGVCGHTARSKQDLKTHRRQLHKSK